MSGLSWFGVEVTASLPSLPTMSQAQPEPKRVAAALLKASLKAPNPPSSLAIACASAPVGSPPPPGFMIVQNSEWFAWPPPLFRTAVRIASGKALRLAISCSIGLPWCSGWSFKRGVEIVDVGLMVLVVMELHRLGTDMRFQGSVVIRQRRHGVFGHGVAPWLDLSLVQANPRRRHAGVPVRSPYHTGDDGFKSFSAPEGRHRKAWGVSPRHVRSR